MLILISIPILLLVIIVRHAILRHQLKTDKSDNAALYKEIGRLNKQVLSLMDEKNSILALKVNAMGGTERIPYMGASALTDDVIPTVDAVTNSASATSAANPNMPLPGTAALAAAAAQSHGKPSAGAGVGAGAPIVQAVLSEAKLNIEHRFPKLTLVDEKYAALTPPEYDNEISLQEFAEGYRRYAASQMKLYYTPEIVRRFVAGMAASKLLILEGISGTGKTSLPYRLAVICLIRQLLYRYSHHFVIARSCLVISMSFQSALTRLSFCVRCMRRTTDQTQRLLCLMR